MGDLAAKPCSGGFGRYNSIKNSHPIFHDRVVNFCNKKVKK